MHVFIRNNYYLRTLSYKEIKWFGDAFLPCRLIWKRDFLNFYPLHCFLLADPFSFVEDESYVSNEEHLLVLLKHNKKNERILLKIRFLKKLVTTLTDSIFMLSFRSSGLQITTNKIQPGGEKEHYKKLLRLLCRKCFKITTY